MKICKSCNIQTESGTICETCKAPLTDFDGKERSEKDPLIIDVEFEDASEETKEDAREHIEEKSDEDDLIDAEGNTGAMPDKEELDKGEEKRLRKERERRNREDKKRAKEELKRIKKEKKANRKFKKLRRTLKVLAVLIFLFFGGILWYLGHSEISPGFTGTGGGTEKILLAISEDRSKEGKVLLPYEDFNKIIRGKFDPKLIDAVSMATIENAFYSEKEERFVFTLKHLLGKTSLLFEAKANYDGERFMLELSNPRLGSWKLPIFSSSVPKLIKKEVPFPQVGWLKMRDISFESDGLRIIYDLDSDRINEDFELLKRELSEEKAAYLLSSEIKFPAAEIIFENLFGEKRTRFKDEEIRSILAEFLIHPDQIVNWTMLASGEAEDSFIELSNVIYGEENTENALINLRKKKKELHRDYDNFMTDKIEAKLIEQAKMSFDAIFTLHKKAALPSYYYGDGGRLYSQTMQRHLKLEDLGIIDEDDFSAKLYAHGNKAILALDFDNEIWYVKEGDKKIKKENKKAFFKKIHYKDEKRLEGVNKPSLDVHEAIPFANAILSKEGYGSQDLLELRFLSHDDKYAIAIGALKNKPENAPKHYLLEGKDGTWKVIDIFSEQKKLGTELIEEIASGEISPRLLPEVEMADFKRETLSNQELRDLMQRFPEHTVLNYHAIEDGNIYIELKQGDGKVAEFLLTEGIKGKMEQISSGKDRARAIQLLKGKKEFANYKPLFMFRQVNSVFVK